MNPLIPVRALIKDIKIEIEAVRTYAVAVEGALFARPGQFCMVGYPGVGEAPISFSSIGQNGSFSHTIKAVGRVTQFLEGLKEGDYVFLRGPYGKGWPLKKAEGRDILLVAGGLGLAPMRPVIETILSKRTMFGDVTLIYGARNEKQVLFMEELRAWGKGIKVLLTVDEVLHPRLWKHNTGLVTDLLIKSGIDPEDSIAFVCGPEIMMRFICRGLVMTGFLQSHLFVSMERRMKCGVGHCGHCQHYGLFVCRDGPVFSYDEVIGLPDGLL
jgi:sulfhydrogenase subunit gamma (sulfur reductase)